MPTQPTKLGPGPRIELDPFFTSSPWEPTIEPVTDLDRIDLTDPELFLHGDPHASWRALREQAPVFWHEQGTQGTRGKGFWVVTTFEEASEVHRRTDLFSKDETTFIDLGPDDMPYQFSGMDPPEHAKYRKVLQQSFNPKNLNLMIDRVQALVTAVLDEAEKVGEFNFSEQIGTQVPFLATAALFNMPPEAVATLGAGQHSIDYGRTDVLGQLIQMVMDFFDDYTKDWSPGDQEGIISTVLSAEIDGKPIDRSEALATLWIVFAGSVDTTAHATTTGLLSLFHHPDQFNRLRDDLSLLPSAVEEILRWTSTSVVIKHHALSDVELGGQQIKQGDYLATYLPSANRDEKVFTDPYNFDVARPRETPLFTFGVGPHVCLGQHFARIMLKAVFEQLIRRFPHIEQTGPAQRGEAFTMLLVPPLEVLPVRLGPST